MTTQATCWQVTRRDAIVEGYTDHNADLIVGAVTYRSAVGYLPSAIERDTGLAADNLVLFGLIDSTYLTEGDLRSGAYTGARVEIFVVDWTNPGAGAVRTLLVGHLGTVVIRGKQYEAELIELAGELSKPAVGVVSLRCNATLGDSRCGVSLSAVTSSVTAVLEARRVFTDTTRTEADGYFDGGKVTFTSGANNGRTMDVKKYTLSTGRIELYEPLPADIAASDGFSLYRGCDHTFATCDGTFSNADNFRGFPHVPGVSDLLSGDVS